MEAIIAAAGGHTTYMSNGSAKKGDWFLWDFQLKFDMKITYTMGKSMILFVLVNCPRVKNQASRFTIDNNFFDSTHGHHGTGMYTFDVFEKVMWNLF